jgi:muramoyltetrapeptide carboxypeptidase
MSAVAGISQLATAGAVVKPPALRPGDRVGIVAPASAVERSRLLLGCEVLRVLGYEPVYDESIFSTDLYFAGSAERRARELESMFARDDICAIICARGGYGCNYLLPYFNLDIIRRHPKIFVGYSDVTTLLTWFHDSTGLVTFHGPMAAKDFAAPHGVDVPSWQAKTSGELELQGGALLSPGFPGLAEGKLYGGCLSMLAASLGTPYEIRTEDTILLIEDVATHPYQIDRMLMQLKLAGKLAGVRGIVFGEMRDCSPPPNSGFTLPDVLRRCVAGLNVPVAFGLNSGHVGHGNMTMAIGVRVSLRVEETYAALSTLEVPVSV